MNEVNQDFTTWPEQQLRDEISNVGNYLHEASDAYFRLVAQRKDGSIEVDKPYMDEALGTLERAETLIFDMLDYLMSQYERNNVPAPVVTYKDISRVIGDDGWEVFDGGPVCEWCGSSILHENYKLCDFCYQMYEDDRHDTTVTVEACNDCGVAPLTEEEAALKRCWDCHTFRADSGGY